VTGSSADPSHSILTCCTGSLRLFHACRAVTPWVCGLGARARRCPGPQSWVRNGRSAVPRIGGQPVPPPCLPWQDAPAFEKPNLAAARSHPVCPRSAQHRSMCTVIDGGGMVGKHTARSTAPVLATGVGLLDEHVRRAPTRHFCAATTVDLAAMLEYELVREQVLHVHALKVLVLGPSAACR